MTPASNVTKAVFLEPKIIQLTCYDTSSFNGIFSVINFYRCTHTLIHSLSSNAFHVTAVASVLFLNKNV